MIGVAAIRARHERLGPTMDERACRLWCGAEALSVGRGGVAAVRRATGPSRPTIIRGKHECVEPDELALDRVRRLGAGRKIARLLDAGLRPALERLIEPVSRGDPESALRWTAKSARRLAAELTVQKHAVGKTVVCEMLRELGYSLVSPTDEVASNGHEMGGGIASPHAVGQRPEEQRWNQSRTVLST